MLRTRGLLPLRPWLERSFAKARSVSVNVRELFLERLDLRLVVDHDVELIRMLRQIVLVVLLGGVKPVQRRHLRHDRTRERLRRGQLLDIALRYLLLLRVPVENRRTVLGAAVGPLTIELRRVVRDRK